MEVREAQISQQEALWSSSWSFQGPLRCPCWKELRPSPGVVPWPCVMAIYLKETQDLIFFDNFTDGPFVTSFILKPPGSLHAPRSLKAGSCVWPTPDEREMVKIFIQILWLE